jgi:hypothetical protein
MAWQDQQRRAGLRRIWRLARWWIFLPLAVFCGSVVGVALWPWKLEPPSRPEESAVVYLADYGRHSRLALQVDDRWMAEYSFGDWRYFAQGERTIWRGLAALTVPTEGGLGRRHLPLTEDESTFNAVAGSVRSARLEVGQAKLDELLAALESRYEANIATEMVADWAEMTFVKDDLSYHLFYNSNHRTAEWLRSLGCGVRGIPVLSNFRIEEGE